MSRTYFLRLSGFLGGPGKGGRTVSGPHDAGAATLSQVPDLLLLAASMARSAALRDSDVSRAEETCLGDMGHLLDDLANGREVI